MGTIMTSIESFVESKIKNEPYPDLQQFCAYHQWTIDYAHFEVTKEYFEKIRTDLKAEVDQQRREF